MDSQRREELESRLSAYLDDELTAEQRAEMDAFLAGNAEARQLLEELRATITVMQSLPRARASDELIDQMRVHMEKQALLGEPERAEGDGSRTRWSAKPWAAAAILALTTTALYVMWQGVGPDELTTVGTSASPSDSDTYARHEEEGRNRGRQFDGAAVEQTEHATRFSKMGKSATEADGDGLADTHVERYEGMGDPASSPPSRLRKNTEGLDTFFKEAGERRSAQRAPSLRGSKSAEGTLRVAGKGEDLAQSLETVQSELESISEELEQSEPAGPASDSHAGRHFGKGHSDGIASFNGKGASPLFGIVHDVPASSPDRVMDALARVDAGTSAWIALSFASEDDRTAAQKSLHSRYRDADRHDWVGDACGSEVSDTITGDESALRSGSQPEPAVQEQNIVLRSRQARTLTETYRVRAYADDGESPDSDAMSIRLDMGDDDSHKQREVEGDKPHQTSRESEGHSITNGSFSLDTTTTQTTGTLTLSGADLALSHAAPGSDAATIGREELRHWLGALPAGKVTVFVPHHAAPGVSVGQVQTETPQFSSSTGIRQAPPTEPGVANRLDAGGGGYGGFGGGQQGRTDTSETLYSEIRQEAAPSIEDPDAPSAAPAHEIARVQTGPDDPQQEAQHLRPQVEQPPPNQPVQIGDDAHSSLTTRPTSPATRAKHFAETQPAAYRLWLYVTALPSQKTHDPGHAPADDTTASQAIQPPNTTQPR